MLGDGGVRQMLGGEAAHGVEDEFGGLFPLARRRCGVGNGDDLSSALKA